MKFLYRLVFFVMLSLLPGHNYGQAQETDLIFIPDGFPELPFVFIEPGTPSGSGELYFAPGDGEEPVALTSGSQVNNRPGWSPTGRYLAYKEIEPVGESGFYITGNYVYDFLTGEHIHIETVFSGMAEIGDHGGYHVRDGYVWLDERTLAIKLSDPEKYYFLNLETREYRILDIPQTGDPEMNYRGGLIAPISDNVWLFNKWSFAEIDQRSLYTFIWDDVRQEDTTLIEYSLPKSSFAMLSPDRQYIAYTSYDGIVPSLVVRTLDGTQSQVIFTLSEEEAQAFLDTGISTEEQMNLLYPPEWSPDSTRLTFLLNRAVYTINIDGSDLRNLDVFPHLINRVYWVSNDVLRANIPVSDGSGYAFLTSDGTVLDPVLWGEREIDFIHMLPPTADENVIQTIVTRTE